MGTIYKDWLFTRADEKGKTQRVPFFPFWLQASEKRAYETMDFVPPPLTVPPYVFNTFYGFAAARLECEPAEDMGFILDFIDILSGRDAASCKYLLDWFAACVQKPAEKKNATMIMLYGEQGIGKNMLIEFFGNKIIGSSYYKKPEVTNIDDTVFGRFAAVVENTVLLFLDEARGLHKHNEDLKHLISSDEATVEHKGQMPRKTRNAMHIILATNNESVLKIENTDRRNVIIKAAGEKIGDVAYFDSVGAWMDEESNQRGFYDFLMKRDISGVHFQRDRPKTDAYIAAKLDSLPLITKWLVNKCKDAAHASETCVAAVEREHFRNWAKLNGARDTVFSDTIITRQLKKLGVVAENGTRIGLDRAYEYKWGAIRDTIVAETRLDACVLFEEQ